jgi:hypothetical protein
MPADKSNRVFLFLNFIVQRESRNRSRKYGTKGYGDTYDKMIAFRIGQARKDLVY